MTSYHEVMIAYNREALSLKLNFFFFFTAFLHDFIQRREESDSILVLFTTLYKVVLTFESVGKFL